MKVAATINHRNPNNVAYSEVSIIATLKHNNGRVFCITRSYNQLLSCYMLSDYLTGCIFTVFGISKLSLTESHVDRIVERSNEYLASLTDESISEKLEKRSVVNDEGIEVTDTVDYSDVDLTKRIKEQKQKELESKVATTTKKEEVVKKPEAKKKRGRPAKKKPDELVTLF